MGVGKAEHKDKSGFRIRIGFLPQGFLTIVGEEGINLSGGQKQLLGWIRALYHNPQFLILDEPTSSLDSDNRNFIYDLISKLKKDKLVFIISHHLESVKDISDQVIILRNSSVLNYSE